MSALAKILVDRGHPVSGSDPRDNATVQHLESRGVTVFKEQTAESIQSVLATNQQPPVVVISTAIPDTNPRVRKRPRASAGDLASIGSPGCPDRSTSLDCCGGESRKNNHQHTDHHLADRSR
jgi:hypothetical protein